VRPLAKLLESPIIVPCDVREPGQLEAAFSRISAEWGRLVFYSIPSPMRQRKIFTLVLLIAHKVASPWQWMYPAILSSGWRGSPSLS
jgi:hypothetical protein